MAGLAPEKKVAGEESCNDLLRYDITEVFIHGWHPQRLAVPTALAASEAGMPADVVAQHADRLNERSQRIWGAPLPVLGVVFVFMLFMPTFMTLLTFCCMYACFQYTCSTQTKQMKEDLLALNWELAPFVKRWEYWTYQDTWRSPFSEHVFCRVTHHCFSLRQGAFHCVIGEAVEPPNVKAGRHRFGARSAISSESVEASENSSSSEVVISTGTGVSLDFASWRRQERANNATYALGAGFSKTADAPAPFYDDEWVTLQCAKGKPLVLESGEWVISKEPFDFYEWLSFALWTQREVDPGFADIKLRQETSEGELVNYQCQVLGRQCAKLWDMIRGPWEQMKSEYRRPQNHGGTSAPTLRWGVSPRVKRVAASTAASTTDSTCAATPPETETSTPSSPAWEALGKEEEGVELPTVDRWRDQVVALRFLAGTQES